MERANLEAKGQFCPMRTTFRPNCLLCAASLFAESELVHAQELGHLLAGPSFVVGGLLVPGAAIMVLFLHLRAKAGGRRALWCALMGCAALTGIAFFAVTHGPHQFVIVSWAVLLAMPWVVAATLAVLAFVRSRRR
jgi:hypothetical protein